MNRQLWALAVTLWLAIWWQEALASDKPVELRNPTVWHTTEEVSWKVQNCMGKWQIKLPDWECAIVVDLVDQLPIITTPIKEEIAQLQKRWKEMQKEEVFEFWWKVWIPWLFWISGLLWWLILLFSRKSKNLDDEQSLNELLEELKDNFASINENYTDSFLSLHITEITKIKEELSSCVKSLSELGDVDSKETKSIISRLEKLKKKIEVLDKKLKKENRDSLNRIEIEEALR